MAAVINTSMKMYTPATTELYGGIHFFQVFQVFQESSHLSIDFLNLEAEGGLRHSHYCWHYLTFDHQPKERKKKWRLSDKTDVLIST